MTALTVQAAEIAWPPLDAPVRLFLVEARPPAPPPPDVAIVIDASGSLAGPPLARARAFARALVAALHPGRLVSVVAASATPTVLLPLAPAGEVRGLLDEALARDLPRGPTTLARALELARLELGTRPAPDACVVVSDLAWGPASLEAVARLEAGGTAVLPVEATSAFTQAQPARGALVRIGTDEAIASAVAPIAEALCAAEPPSPEGTLSVELEAPPLAWLAGDPLRAAGPGALATARAKLVLGAARLAFAARGEPRGRAVLDSGGATRHAPISVREAAALDDAAALARAARAEEAP